MTNPSLGFNNQIEIPVVNHDNICFTTYLDYYELAENGNGKTFILSGVFMTEENGAMDYEVSDINNNAEIVKAASGLLQYLETVESEKK